MTITGLVFRIYKDSLSGYIAPDKQFHPDVPGNVRFSLDQAEGDHALACGDRVECEIENTDKGYRAVWVRWIGHGWKEPVQFVRGSGRIKYVSDDRAFGFIRSDVKGSANVKFICSTMPDPYFRVGDRVSFIACENSEGKWKATEIRITNKLIRVARNEQEESCY